MKISKIKYRQDNNDGTYLNMECVLPHEIAETISNMFISWKNDWWATTITTDEFIKAKKKWEEDKIEKV